MVDLEQKLRNYYEHNLDYRQSPEALQRLLALEASPQAAKKPRRRYALPVAAAIALALSAGALFAWLHSPSKQAETPEPGYTLTAPSETAPQTPKAPAPTAPAIPEPQTPAEPAPAEAPAEPEITPDPPQSAPPQRAYAPAPVKQDEPAPVEPKEETPELPDDPIPPEPDEPEPPPVEDPPPADDPEPADDPPPEDPPQDDDPPEPTPEESDINAVYRMKGGRELLTLTCLSTGAYVELDVTGWMEEQPEEPEPSDPVTYTGHSGIVDLILDSSVTYHLIRDADGTVRVDLDVA